MSESSTLKAASNTTEAEQTTAQKVENNANQVSVIIRIACFILFIFFFFFLRFLLPFPVNMINIFV